MPARRLPRTPAPTLRFECVWEGCENVAPWEWQRSKWRLRLYCQTHKRLNAKLNRTLRNRGRDPRVVGTWNGALMVRVDLGRRLPWHVARYKQLLGGGLDGGYVTFREMSLAGIRLHSPAVSRYRWRWIQERKRGREEAASV